ncbi:hypothetical protein BGZ59_005587 [Podila verticillata]|nr:hypothetical protein BGZ59_005587 [Podila verticillata]
MPQPKWKTEQVPSHKFEFINIADFHNKSPWARLRYTWVWVMFLKAILVFCGDIWTCTILIISGDWTSDIKPTIDISIARWIFTACILLSFVLLATDFRKANKVIKSQDISYAVSNKIVSGFYCLQKFNYFCFIEKIHNSSKLHDKLSFFVFFQLKGWKHLVVQAPRQVINIMTLIAFMKALGFDFTNLNDVAQLLPSLKTADKFTFCVMVFTSLMFIISGVATLIAIVLWIPLVAKVQGNLKEYVCHKMDKRIDAIIKKTTKERAKKLKQQEELEIKEEMSNNGRGGGGTSGPSKKSLAPLSKRPKPTLPDIDVILANASEDQASRFYTQQQQFQQSYQSHHVQHSYNSPPPPPSQLQPVQSQQYHDTNPHASFQRANTGDPEHWPAHYGFTVESALSETPSSTEHFSEYRPDSGVLPNTNDPYYVQMTSFKVECHDDDLYGESEERRLGLVRTQSKSGNKVYRPDKTEIEQYDSLYKGITETHLRAKANRSTSLQSRSSRASNSTSTGPSYAASLRQQNQQKQYQDTRQRIESPILDARQGIDGLLQTLRHQTSFESRCLEPLSYQNPDRPVSVLAPPLPTFMNETGASGSNAGSSTPPSSSPRRSFDRPLHQPASPAASHISLIRVSTEQFRTQSMTSSSASYRPASPACSNHIREFTPGTRDGKQELVPISVPPPPVVPLPPVPVVGAIASPIEPLRIEDVIDDIASTLGPVEKAHYPPPPTTTSSVFSPREQGSSIGTPTFGTSALAPISIKNEYFQNHDESSHKVEVTDEVLEARKESLDLRVAPAVQGQEDEQVAVISQRLQNNYPYLQQLYEGELQQQPSASSTSLNSNPFGVARSGSPSLANMTASTSVSSLSGHKMSHLASAIRASMESTRPSHLSTLSRPSGERTRPSMDQ